MPISWTLGIESGRGVVSMRTCWLNLVSYTFVSERRLTIWKVVGMRACLGSRAAILRVVDLQWYKSGRVVFGMESLKLQAEEARKQPIGS